MRKNFQIAHSPDADDIFMYMAIKFGWCGTHNYTNKALDIETLNEEAIKGTFDASAISFGLYPHIVNEYALLRTAVSFGDGYGPKIIKLKEKKLKSNFTVALSGKYTTNALIFRLKYPQARVRYYNFLEIEGAVLRGEVDAGVLIHESILDFDKSLEVEAHLWDIWREIGSKDLPLPLGGMAVRRSLTLLDAINIEKDLCKAVSLATKNKALMSKMLQERSLVRVDDEKLNIYLNLYANEASVSMDEAQLDALGVLFDLGFKAGVYKSLIDPKEVLLPLEYEEDRFS